MNKEEKINDLFRQAREQQSQTSFQETKDLFLKSLVSQATNNNSGKGKVFTFKNRIIMSTLIGIIAIYTTLLLVKEEPKNKEHSAKNNTDKTILAHKSTSKGSQSETNLSANTKKSSPQENKFENNGFPNFLNEDIPSTYELELQNHFQDYNYGQDQNDEYVFPKLTEIEIEKTKKQKKKMLKALAKIDRNSYAYIPAGSFEYKGQMISVSAFNMQKTEVSNLEYRTFLFDLLIQNRKDEFLKAKPVQDAWKIALGDSAQYMIDNYFSNEMYDNYPVNNISREGAELYCKWLTKELILFVGEKEAVKYNDLRIPTRQEWVKAASVEGKFKNYPVEDDSIYDKKINVFIANFNLKDKSNTIRKGGYKTDMEKKAGNYYTPINYFMKGINCYLAPCGFNFRESTSYGIFQLSGNIAEMVVDGANNTPKVNDTIPKKNRILTPGTAGGGWMNSAEEIKINAPDNYPNRTEAHPNIGFRVIMTHLGKGAYIYKQGK